MLLLLLLPTVLPKLLQSLELTSDSPDPPKTLQRFITNCPSVGYFFERQDHPGHPGTCYLCYCKNDGVAGCTLRDSERCDGDDNSYQRDVEAVQRNGRSLRRSRRNPGLMEFFFNDANKDTMVKSLAQANEEDCKPKDSKSIGCPPKDWCKGCLVCDCDEHGEWQCHVMSFCEDKTPRPGSKKFLKPGTKETVATEKYEKTTINTLKKNDKRSVKPKKKNFKKVSSTTNTTAKKPAVPQISVKTLKKFIRKDQMKNATSNLLVIKKYISTISPIESPELLKYKNDSRKLAQLLYQQYESSTKETHRSKPAKREIKLEKILNTKQKRNFEFKYNARSRKPLNVKEHSDWNKKMKARTAKRESKILQNFYTGQNALMNPNEKNKIEVQKGEENEGNEIKGNYKRKEKVIYIPRKRRHKRDLLSANEISSNVTIVESELVNITTVNGEVSEPPARVFRNNQEIESNLTNYKYTVDDMGPQTDKHENGTENNDTVYETTFKYADLTTIENRDYEKEHFTITNVPNITNIDDDSTTKQQNYDSQTLNFKAYTLSEITGSAVNPLKLINNQSLDTTTSIDYTLNVISISEKELKGEENRELETTTVNDFSTIGLYRNTTEKLKLKDIYSKINNDMNETDTEKVHVKDMNKTITDLSIYKLQRITQGNETNLIDTTNHTSMNNTLISFKTDFEKMLQRFSNNSSKYKPQQNGMIAVKYLKKLYSQLLSKKNNKTRLNNIVVMESICDTFGPCKISTNKVGLINYKITELITEAKKALDVIKIIKGHLQLVDSKNNNTGETNEETEFKRYVKQLNAIITDNYEPPLTETEITQMNYVKNKTKVFINSVANFASILNDIIKIIHSQKIKYDSLKKRHKLIINRVTRHKVDNGPLHKIKSLFLKFNLLQNTFMHNMYQAITELERQNNKTPTDVDKNTKGQRDKRYKMSVNKYMNKINYNLEKLKELALKMGAKQRRKRNAMRNDDAVEYLLTLMEYLLKQNNPVDTPPVADGIDLLIDAIRRAPDIKPIRKKVLKQMSSMPPFPYFKPLSKSSSESEEDDMKNPKQNLKENLSFEKPYSNDTLILNSNNDELEQYRRPTSDVPQQPTEVTTTKYVDVEDLVFNGNVLQKVYMATIPYESTDDSYSEKDEVKPLKPKKAHLKINESVSGTEEDTLILTIKNDTDTESKSENNTSTTETTIKTQFDRLNEEYEKEMKVKASSTKNLKIKRRKGKRLRKKQKEDTKSDVSSVTKEVDEEKTRKKVVAEETILRKQIIATDVDPFQSMDDESASRDVSPLDAMDNEVFPSYFTK